MLGILRKIQQVAQTYPHGLLVLAVSTFVLFLARGMVLPFLVIYFAQVVGLGEGTAGLGIALSSVLGVLVMLALAGLIDRWGARRILLVALVFLAATHGTLWLGDVPARFFLLMALFGVAVNLYWPASDTLATAFLPPERAGEVFALMRVANALGLGLGGVFGGLLVRGGGIEAYRCLFLASAAGVLLAAAMVGLLVPPVHRGLVGERQAVGPGGWGQVLRNPRFLASQLLVLLGVGGVTMLQVSVPPYLRTVAGFSEPAIGSLFALNTLVVVFAQVPVARVLRGLPFAQLFALVGIGWALAYLQIALAPVQAILAYLGVLVYSLAELLFMPLSGAVTVALADPAYRARYLAFASLVWAVGWGGTAWATGLLLEAERYVLLWGGTVGVMFGLAGLAYLLRALVERATVSVNQREGVRGD